MTKYNIIINIEKCKGCELCIKECNKGKLIKSYKTNENGYCYPKITETECIGCGNCFQVCSNWAIEIQGEDND